MPTMSAAMLEAESFKEKPATVNVFNTQCFKLLNNSLT